MAKILTRFTVHHHLAMQLIVEIDRGGISTLGLLSNAAGSVLSNQQKGQANSHDSYSHAKQALDRLGANIFIENVACSKSRRRGSIARPAQQSVGYRPDRNNRIGLRNHLLRRRVGVRPGSRSNSGQRSVFQ